MAEINPDEVFEVDLDATLDPPVTVEKVLAVEEIRALIAQLSVTEEGEPLKTAMAELKKGIKANPAACSTLLPEDIGAMVTAIYKMTDRDLTAAIEKANKTKSKAKPKFDFSDKNVQQEILDDLG